MTTNFDNILGQLHSNAILSDIKPDGTAFPVITITEERKFNIPPNYNTVIAYAGDVNSQIVTFQIDRYQDGHDLGACAYKKLVWKNLTSDYEGASGLVLDEITAEDTKLIARWQVPAAAFAHAGQLEIAISIYDLIGDKIGYSWNTATSTAFSVGATTSDLDYSGDDFYIPAKNEILYINENRQITMPNGYNPIIANYGDVGTSKVYFRVKSNIAGINVLDDKTSISVLINFNDCTTSESIGLGQRKSFVESVGDEYVILEWNVSRAITDNNDFYFGTITIGLSFSTATLKWSTLPFSGLLINEALVEGDETREERVPFLAQTLANNDPDKAPSVKAVNEGLALKAEKTDVEALEKEVLDLNIAIGGQYTIKTVENNKPEKRVPSKAVGTQIFINRLEPTWCLDGLTAADITTGNKIANAYSVGDYEDYNSDVFSVSVNPNGSSLTINTLDVDATYNEVINVHFDSVEVKAGEPVFLAYRVVSGSYTPTGAEPKLRLMYKGGSIALPLDSTRTPDDDFCYYMMPCPLLHTFSYVEIDLSDEVAFNNFTIDVVVGTGLGSGYFVGRLAEYLGGIWLNPIKSFSYRKNVGLDEGCIDKETFKISYNYVDMVTRELVVNCEQVLDEGGTKRVVPCEERRISIDDVLTEMDWDGFIEVSAGDKIGFGSTLKDDVLEFNYSVFSYVVSNV